jgi:muramoyltetrapeptide carboxypeptidase
MQKLQPLKPGDRVELIAPASRCTSARLEAIKTLCESWGLVCVIEPSLFGDDLLCANDDEARFNAFRHALLREDTQAIFCVRGGYGSARLIPALMGVSKPPVHKLFVGMSDITALHLYLQQAWDWPVILGCAAPDQVSDASIQSLKSILFGETAQVQRVGVPMNASAREELSINAPCVTGGNLCLVQASIGTPWQMQGADKIIFLEEVGERGYRIDRMLEHLRQAGLFNRAKAIIFGDCIEGEEPDGSSLIDPVLQRFASHCDIPVVRMEGIGHGHTNWPLVLGARTTLHLGETVQLHVNVPYS